jgi:hypothetical protein
MFAKTMTTFDDIEAFRRTPNAEAFARAWIAERKSNASSCDHLINLTIWSRSHPHQALGIVLNLIDQSKEDGEMSEMVAMGPVTEIVEATDDTFTPLLQRTVSENPKFALYTQYNRLKSQDPKWLRLSKR